MLMHQLIGLIDAVAEDGNQDIVLRYEDDNGDALGDYNIENIFSWRGSYEKVSIGRSSHPVNPQDGPTQCVADIVRHLESAIGTAMFGYKGGEYAIFGDSEVKADPWGECIGWTPTAVIEEEGLIVILCHLEDPWT